MCQVDRNKAKPELSHIGSLFPHHTTHPLPLIWKKSFLSLSNLCLCCFLCLDCPSVSPQSQVTCHFSSTPSLTTLSMHLCLDLQLRSVMSPSSLPSSFHKCTITCDIPYLETSLWKSPTIGQWIVEESHSCQCVLESHSYAVCWLLVSRGLQVLSCWNRESYWCFQHVPVWSPKAAQLCQGMSVTAG